MALPQYPQMKRDLSKIFLGLTKKAIHAREPLLGELNTVTQHEGDKSTFGTVEGTVQEIKYERMSSETHFKPKDIPGMKVEDAIQIVQKQGAELADQQAKHFFQKVSEAAENSGNVHGAGGKPFTINHYFEVLEKTEMTFDEEGNPHKSTLVVSPEQAPKMKAVFEEAQKDPKNEEKYKAIIARKKEAWDAKENHRKLVD